VAYHPFPSFFVRYFKTGPSIQFSPAFTRSSKFSLLINSWSAWLGDYIVMHCAWSREGWAGRIALQASTPRAASLQTNARFISGHLSF
jgi:hypothetical protein